MDTYGDDWGSIWFLSHLDSTGSMSLAGCPWIFPQRLTFDPFGSSFENPWIVVLSKNIKKIQRWFVDVCCTTQQKHFFCFFPGTRYVLQELNQTSWTIPQSSPCLMGYMYGYHSQSWVVGTSNGKLRSYLELPDHRIVLQTFAEKHRKTLITGKDPKMEVLYQKQVI